jgi:hypothetical protein
MGIDLLMFEQGGVKAIAQKRGNTFCHVLNQVTGIDLCEGRDEGSVIVDNAKLCEVNNALNAINRASMAWKIESRGGWTIGEAINFVANYATWIETHAEAGHYMVVG